MSPTVLEGSLDPVLPESTDGTLKLRLDNSAVGSAAAVIRSGSGAARTVVIRDDALSISVPAGEVTVEMQLPSGELLVQQVDLKAGGEQDLTFEVDPSGKEWLRWQSIVSPNWRPRAPKPVQSSRQKQQSIAADFSQDVPLSSWRERVLGVERVGLSGTKRHEVPVPVDRDYLTLPPDLTVEGDERALSVTFFSQQPPSPTPHGKTALAVRLQPIGDEPPLTVCAMIPSPWRSTWGPDVDQPQRVQVLVQAQPTGVGGVSTEVIIQDKQVGPVLAYLGTGDLGSAEAYADDLQHMARELLWEKVANPFAAAVGAYLMLRLEVSELSWTELLWRKFPWLPDGGIVHAAHLLRSADRSTNLNVVRDALVSAAQAGVPFFVDGVRRLTAGLSQIASSSRFKSDPEVIGALRYARALSAATVPQAQCTTLIVPSDRLDDLLFGATHFSNSQLAVGAPIMIRDEYRQKFAPVLKALKDHRAELAAIADLVIARPGFDPSEDALVPALVLAFRPPHRPSAVDYSKQFGVHTVEVEADPEEQLIASRSPGAVSALAQALSAAPGETFAPAKYGNYVKPTGAAAPRLDAVDEEMKVTIAASPDAGWPLLKEFLDVRARERLTVGMYQFTAPHVYKALRENLRHGNARLSIGLDPKPEPIAGTGTKADDLYGPTILDGLERYLGPRFLFDWASVGKGAAFTTAYHIKVAVADGERFWLSTGNWQSSNLPPFDPINAPDDLPQSFGSNYNREYHVVIEHEQLASTYEKFLDYDRSLPGQFAQPVMERLPDLILPPEDPEALPFALRRWHEPLRLQRKLKVQPLLTPDNYAPHVLAALQSAKKSIYLQNQYISLNAQGDLKEFRDLVGVLLEKIDAKLDVRIIVRDFMQPEKFDLLYAMGFPKDVFRVQKSCHAKLIVVDGKKAVVGSHNWSNDGTVTNRDASLLFDDVEVAEYLETIFLEDWERARRKAPRRQPRVARDGEKPFTGGRRAPWSAWSEEPPRVPAAPPAKVDPTPASATSVVPAAAIAFGAPGPGGNVMTDVVTFNGIHARTGKYLMPEATLADVVKRIRLGGAAAKDGEKDAATRRQTESFAPPFGTDPNDVKSSGWAVVWGPNTPPSVKQKLKPLLDHRKARAGRFFQEYTVQPGESVASFLTRCGVSLASGVKPHKLGYHVLLVASPEEVSFEFQYLLDLDYSVGRLHFDDEAGYGAYADATVRYETSLATPVRKREIAYWGPRHAGDGATALSSKYMVSALEHGEPELGSIADRVGASQHLYLADKATRKQLLDLLGGGAAQPGLVFTAGHGMGVTSGEPGQKDVQGALLSSDWKGLGQISPDDYVAARNVDDNADATGLIAFFFACFGGGTPARDTFAADGQGDVIAPAPFVSALPQRLLGHPRKPALAVIGHVDRAWGLSIKPLGATDSQLGPYETFIGRVLRGECVGNGMTDLHGRAAILSSELGDLLMPGSGRTSTDAELVYLWLQRNDARAYVLFGDPAVKLR